MSKEIIYRKLEDLKKLPNNPRTITKEDMLRLQKSIQDNADYFEARPLILSNRTGELVILAGNQRYEAAKALGLETVPTFLLEGLTEEREREIIIRDNVSNGEWDMDILANEWDTEDLSEWGVDLPILDTDEVIEQASLGTVEEYNEDNGYNLKNLVRESVSSDILEKLDNGEKSGKIRPEIADILRKRAEQCSIFDFDEITKFYRSGDASEEEKELLRRLYLVFITPKETIEKAMLEVDKLTSEIYDITLMEKNNER